MSEIKKSKLSPAVEHFIKGLFIILLAGVIALNVGKIGRTLAFPFIYFFGVSSYILLAFMVFHGLYHIFAHRKLKIKSPLTIIGIISFFVGLSMVLGFILMAKGGLTYNIGVAENVKNLNAELSHYYQKEFLNLFVPGSYWNIGLIGITICSLIGNDVVILALGIIFLIVSAIFLSIKPAIFLYYRIIGHKERKEAIKKVEIEEEEPEEEIVPIFVPEPQEEKMDVPYGYEVEEDLTPNEDLFIEDHVSLDEPFSTRKFGEDQYNEFTKLEFRRKEEPIINLVNKEPVREAVEPAPYVEKEIANEEFNDPDLPNFEDVYLDEEAEEKPQPIQREIPAPTPVVEEDKPTLFTQPVFEEPKPVVNPYFNNVEPTPVVEEKKKKERVNWVAPSTDILETYEVSEAIEANSKAAEERMEAINRVLENFNIGAKCTSYTIGSSVTRFNIEYQPNVSMKNVEKLVTDIALRLGGLVVRFSPIVEGEAYSGLEIPNVKITTVGFKDVFELLPDVKKHPLAVGFGKNISGRVVYADFDEFPHLLVAGTTGSGKSIYTHSIISTLIMRMSPDDLKIVLVDPKRVEMTKYREMPHLLCPIITEADKAKVMLSKLVDEMNARYQKFSDAEECSNIKQYNEWAREHNEDTMPYILVVIDEYADLVDNCKEISQPVVSIAQKARAAGIHMLISTQRPSTNIITGVIKGNLPTHVALMTSSYIDSMTIIGEGGAEKLLGKGDMLVQSPLVSRVGVTRLQGCFIQNKEINRIVGYLKEHYPTVYDENFLDLVDHSKEVGNAKVAGGVVEKEADAAEENRYQSIKEWVMTQQFVSMSKIQRECSVGFNRAGRFFNRLQKEGIVSTEQDGTTKGCKVLVHDDFSSSYDEVGSDELTRY